MTEVQSPQVLIYGPDPSDPARTGGVITHMRYLAAMATARELSTRFLYSDWPSSRLVPRPARRLLGVLRSCGYLLFGSPRGDTVVHVNTSLYRRAGLRDCLVVASCVWKGLPVYLQLHGGRRSNVQGGITGWIWEWMFAHAEAIGVFPGPQWAEFMASPHAPRLDRTLNMVVPTEGAPGEGGHAHFLFMGRLVREKGVLDVLESFRKLCSEGDDQGRASTLTIAGEGPLLDELEREIAGSESPGRIEVTGYVSGDEWERVMSRCNVFVLPSEAEGFPLSFLECAERGMACVMSTNSAIPEVFEKGEEFLPIRPGDRQALYRTMRRLASDEELRRRLGESARRAVHRCCTVESAGSGYVEVYDRLARTGS